MHTPSVSRLALALAAVLASGAVFGTELIDAQGYAQSKRQLQNATPALHASPAAGTEMRVTRDAAGNERIQCLPVRSERADRARSIFRQQKEAIR